MSVMPSGRAAQAGLSSQILVALAALAIMAAGFGLVALWLSAGAPPPPPPRNPFGVGPREAAPSATGLGALIMDWQSAFYRQMTAALKAIAESAAATPTLLGLGFLYGVVHAAGPGHGKAVISAYIVADDRSAALRGFSLSLAAALMQALVAIGVVLVFSLLLKATGRAVNAATHWLEMASFAAVAALGLVILWRKAGELVGAARGEPSACAPGCSHAESLALGAGTARPLREVAGVILAAGIRPCAGAIIILVFALSQGLLWAGVAATFAMALGTAMTTGAIALAAVAAKHVALRLAAGRGQRAALVIRVLECLAAAFVAALGLVLVSGYWSASAG
jgi:ABC-type nickel/cobalt efflux system permease component RcnA